MAKKCYIGVDNMARKARSIFVGIARTDLDEILKDLPEGYVQLDYIHSDGSQYINTGFKPNQDTRIVLDLEIESTKESDFSSILGARVSYDNTAFSVWASASAFHDDYNSDYTQNNATTLARNVIDKNKNITTVAGVTFTHTYAAFQSTYDMLIGTCNQSGTGYGYGLVGKIYSCQVYDNDTLIRDYVPCKNPSGVVGMYDLVNSKFYQNSGSGSFTAGNILDANSGLARPTRKAYIGIGGVARPFFMGCIIPTTYGTVSGSFTARYLHSAAVAGYGIYAIWAGGRTEATDYDKTADGVTSNLVQVSIPDLSDDDAGAGTAASIGEYAIFRNSTTASAYSKNLVVSALSGLSSTPVLNYSSTAAASNASFAIFDGGAQSDIYAIDKNLVITAAPSLSVGRKNMGAASNGREVIFAGGYTTSASRKTYKNTAEAYDKNLVITVLANLSWSRAYVAGARAGTNVIFGGGMQSSGYKLTDAYNYNLVKTDISEFSVARESPAGMTVGECAVFAGGSSSDRTAECYDDKLVKREVEGISVARKNPAGLSFGDYGLIIAGGSSGSELKNVVDAYVAL